MKQPRVIMATLLFLVAACYLAVVNWLVLDDYNTSWTKLDWDDIFWICAPVAYAVINGIVLLMVNDQQPPSSKYTGTKYDWL